jgi:isopenicillin N synthase-like dioxygenase
MRETGFGVVVNHPLADSGLIPAVYREWSAFFSGEAKFGYDSRGGQSGYFPLDRRAAAEGAPKRDRKEFFQISPGGPYPDGVPDTAQRYFEAAQQLAGCLLGWLDERTPREISDRFSLPLPKMLAGASGTTLRIQRYLPATGAEGPDAMRALAHTDLNLLTVLPSPTEPGLQVCDTAGVWHDVPCGTGAFVINGGEMLEQITSGHYPATRHRVRFTADGSSGRSRFSLPLFLHPAGDVRLTDDHTAASFLQKRIEDLRTMGWTPAPGGEPEN